LGSRALLSAIAAIADSEPDGLSINTNPAMFNHLEGVRDEWRTAVRPALLEFAIRTDSQDASQLARTWRPKSRRGLRAPSSWSRQSCGRPTDSLSDYWKPANEKNEWLVALAGELEKILRGNGRLADTA
jgi:hypothetical protein